jgi:hypothetical protein
MFGLIYTIKQVINNKESINKNNSTLLNLIPKYNQTSTTNKQRLP